MTSPDRLMVAGICRNIATHLPRTIERIRELERLLPGLPVVIYENNSTDATREILAAHADSPGWHFISEEVPEARLKEACLALTWDGKPSRTEVIAMARNRLMEEIERIAGTDQRLAVLMLDLDIWHWHPAQIPELLRLEGWDALTVNGMDRLYHYRDASAFRSRRFPFGPELLGEYWWKKTCIDIHRQVFRDEIPIPVYSAFGGLALYRWEAIRGLRYAGVVNDAYHADLKARLEREPLSAMTRFRLWKAGKGAAAAATTLFGDGVAYMNNSGYKYPVVCEHVPFHAAMRLRGAGRIFVCPEWKLWHYE